MSNKKEWQEYYIRCMDEDERRAKEKEENERKKQERLLEEELLEEDYEYER
jgi:hypothetical protein